jgi:hypothetical protein
MKIYLTDQSKHFKKHLKGLRACKIMDYKLTSLTAKVSTMDLNEESFQSLDFRVLFDYKIFPENIMSSMTQWNFENREMQVGDTIVQQVYIPPIKTVSQKIIFGVRIKEIFDEEFRRGYSYETLEGHVEKGISTFTIEKLGDKCIFKIETFSCPGNLLTKILSPIFSIPYQTFCTNVALNNVRSHIRTSHNTG